MDTLVDRTRTFEDYEREIRADIMSYPESYRLEALIVKAACIKQSWDRLLKTAIPLHDDEEGRMARREVSPTRFSEVYDECNHHVSQS